MIELLATSVITLSSALLFVYWFRYTCMLILSAKTTRDYAADVATANQLSFPQVQNRLREQANADLGALVAALDRDYAVITYLLNNAPRVSTGASTVETKMLAVNYRVMRTWFSVSRSRRALEEMANVVAHFANAMGERAALSTSAA